MLLSLIAFHSMTRKWYWRNNRIKRQQEGRREREYVFNINFFHKFISDIFIMFYEKFNEIKKKKEICSMKMKEIVPVVRFRWQTKREKNQDLRAIIWLMSLNSYIYYLQSYYALSSCLQFFLLWSFLLHFFILPYLLARSIYCYRHYLFEEKSKNKNFVV